MALIRASCNTCGNVELRSKQVTVRICNDTDDASYYFRCPICQLVEIKVIDERDKHIIDILITNGCKPQFWDIPSELWEPTPEGPPIDHDDLLDFHELLMSPGWYETLRAMT